MKNILQIMDYAAAYRGNFIPSMETLADHWKLHGNMVFVFPDVAQAIPWVQELVRKRSVYFISSDFFSKQIKLKNIQQLKKIVEEEKISVIHTHFVEANYSLYLFAKFVCPSIRYVASLHNHYEVHGRLGWLRKRIFISLYDRVIGVSASVSDSATKIGCNPKDVLVARNSINFERLDTTIDSPIIDKGGYQYVVMLLGHPWERKGIDIAVKALEKLNERERCFKLAIVYSGRIEDYEQIIREKLGSIPAFIKVYPPIENIVDYYNSSDIFLSASREEGFCYALVEGAYCKPYIITSNIPAPMSLAIPYMASYEVENHEELVAKLQDYMYYSSDDLRNMKKVQREYVIKEFNLLAWAKNVSVAYL